MASNEQKTKNTVVEIAPQVASTAQVNAPSGSDEGGLTSSTRRTTLLMLNCMTILCAVISLSCAGGFNKNNWDGSHAGFLLFVGLTSIFLTTALMISRFYFSAPPRALHVLYTDTVANAVYSILWFATALDNAVQRGKLDNACGNDFYGIACGKIDAAIAFAFFACFSSIGATVVATMMMMEQRRNA